MPYCRPCASKRSSIQQKKLWLDVITHYGTACVCCGKVGLECLSLHHVNRDGAEERRRDGGNRANFRRIRDQEFPPDYEVLCGSCHDAISYYGFCPHKQTYDINLVFNSYYRRLRLDCLRGYGGKCTSCGETELLFLSLHHPDNNGAEERKRVSHYRELYQEARENNYPPDWLSILCGSCHDAETWNHGEFRRPDEDEE
jgi:hypothetical protein